jgi:hypothetical protein
MIYPAFEQIPTTITLPPSAIMRFHQSANDIDPWDSLFNYPNNNNNNIDKKQKIILFSDKKIMLTAIDYFGFETVIHSFNNCKADAVSRYKQVYKTDKYNTDVLKPFLDAIQVIVYNSRLIPRFSFYPDGAKAVFTFNNQEITVEYDFDEPEFVFVSKFVDDVLHVKNSTIDNLSHAWGEFM